jgi:DNA-binding MarR family transcriptional regulator
MVNNGRFLCYRADMAAEKVAPRLEDQWRDILSVHARTMCEIDRELHPHGLGASDFEVLDILASTTATSGPDSDSHTGRGSGTNPSSGAGPVEQCRVQNIADRVHLSQSALSRLIGRLEKEGLVERSVCQEDRRGVWVALTGKGRDLHTEVRPLQRAVLARMLADS